jgi:hypothetical protein
MGRVSLIITILALFASTAAAAITPVAPFVGDLLEDFESFPPTASTVFVGAPNSFSVFAGAATHTTLTGFSPTYWWTGNWGLGNATAKAADGNKGFGINGNATGEFAFSTPIDSFGAYFATAFPTDTMFVRFFDAANVQIGADQTFSYFRSSADGVMEWHGWDLNASATRVVWGSLSQSGAAPTLDSIRVTLADNGTVPEPASFVVWAALALIGGCVAYRRTRNAA